MDDHTHSVRADPWEYVNTLTQHYWYGEHPESSKGRDEMRGLYRVLVVDPEDDLIEVDELVIAASEEKARIKVLLARTLIRDLDDYDVICQKLGSVRGKTKPQEVKIV